MGNFTRCPALAQSGAGGLGLGGHDLPFFVDQMQGLGPQFGGAGAVGVSAAEQ